MVLCNSCDGVPLNSKRKTGGPPVYQHGLSGHSIDPDKNSLENTFNWPLSHGLPLTVTDQLAGPSSSHFPLLTIFLLFLLDYSIDYMEPGKRGKK
jgi:hypothetical protein